jgi:hypothetical protein
MAEVGAECSLPDRMAPTSKGNRNLARSDIVMTTTTTTTGQPAPLSAQVPLSLRLEAVASGVYKVAHDGAALTLRYGARAWTVIEIGDGHHVDHLASYRDLIDAAQWAGAFLCGGDLVPALTLASGPDDPGRLLSRPTRPPRRPPIGWSAP